MEKIEADHLKKLLEDQVEESGAKLRFDTDESNESKEIKQELENWKQEKHIVTDIEEFRVAPDLIN